LVELKKFRQIGNGLVFGGTKKIDNEIVPELIELNYLKEKSINSKTGGPNKVTQVYLDEVTEVIYDQQEYWPLTQRYWLYRIMAKKGWLKVDEYSSGKYPKEKRGLCTPGKNLNNILLRGRRSGLISWEAIVGSRGMRVDPMSVDSPDSLADRLKWDMDNFQFDRQSGQVWF